jgi:cytochrome b6-f complex iron-sulfur subunit
VSKQNQDKTEADVQPLVARPSPTKPVVTRRRFLLAGFWSGLLFAPVGLAGALLNFIWPRRVGAFGGPFVVPASQVPEPGAEPVRFPIGRFYLSHLAPGQEGSPGGLLAVYQKCTHLGCTVPWRPDFNFEGTKGWFRCPCHGSTFTRGTAIRVYGPAPRPLDLMAVEVKENGDLVVNTGDITLGSEDNPQRAVPYSPPAAAKGRAGRKRL